MLTAFVRAFQTPDLRKKLLITLGLIALFRLGASLPTPGFAAGGWTAASDAKPPEPRRCVEKQCFSNT